MAVTAGKTKPASRLPPPPSPAKRKKPVSASKTGPASAKAATPALVKAARTVKEVKVEPAAKAEKIKKPKLVRDSFTIPKGEYTALQDFKERAAALGSPVKKSELLRAGLKALAAMSDAAFLAALAEVPALKTGRPAKSGATAAS